jgi:hypothetical protein
LPKEGTLVSITENLGRTLFARHVRRWTSEYLFEGEVEVKDSNPLRHRYGAGNNVAI